MSPALARIFAAGIVALIIVIMHTGYKLSRGLSDVLNQGHTASANSESNERLNLGK
jgi:hypothetical protein